MNKFIILAFSFCLLQMTFAQQDTVALKTANISDAYLLRFSETQNKVVLSDSILKRNGSTLTNLLNFNSTIYLKESGAGMISSPSFRGTTASQTAVVWNGININSQFLGQSDFNTISSQSYNSIFIKSGGGSVAHGSGAIGGSIHLNNELKFNQGFQSEILAKTGSFGMYGIHLNSKFSDQKSSFQFNVGRNGSDNNYPYLDSDKKNRNGNYYNNSFNLSAAHKLNSRNTLSVFGEIFNGERHFSLISPNALPTKYQDYNSRFLIEWNSVFRKFNSTLKIARIGEEYRYFPTIHSKKHENGNGNTWLAKYDLTFQHKNLVLNALLDASHAEGSGTQIHFAKRQTASAGLLLKHRILKNLLYEGGARQEISDVYKSPFLYSLGLKWDVNSYYQLRFHSSKNFRMPTFNDLFWPGSGNPDLSPETSIQSEIGNQFQFRNFKIDITAFHNSIENLIQWIPLGSLSVPENVGNVKVMGIETTANYLKKWNNQQLEFSLNYAYNHSEDQRKSTQLIYVPFHKSSASASYSYRSISGYFQTMYTGEVFTDSNNLYSLQDYWISNAGLELNIGKNRKYLLGGQVLNLFNQKYENVLNRPMPGINYNVYINLKF